MQHNECPLALTIAPNAILHPGAHVGPALTGMTSIRGRCHTFDARADGYLRGEGCGAVVLETEHRGNHVSCLGSSARHNGQSATFTALNGLSQQLLIKAALSDASTTVGYVMEAHGTGTGLGDPIEISSISAIVKKSGHKSCSVCAIKGNVGHTESTAGVANVIEVIGLLRLGEAALNVHSARSTRKSGKCAPRCCIRLSIQIRCIEIERRRAVRVPLGGAASSPTGCSSTRKLSK